MNASVHAQNVESVEHRSVDAIHWLSLGETNGSELDVFLSPTLGDQLLAALRAYRKTYRVILCRDCFETIPVSGCECCEVVPVEPAVIGEFSE